MAVWELMLTTSTVSGGSGMTEELDLGQGFERLLWGRVVGLDMF